MQIHKRNILIYNLMLFVGLSFVYLHVCFSLDADISALDFERLAGLFTGMPLLVIGGGVTLLSLYKIKRVSVTCFIVFSLLIFYKTFSIFLITYDKFILLLNVIYLVTSFNLVVLLVEELGQAIYSKKFNDGAMDVESYMKLKVELINNDKKAKGCITNLDKDGFIVKLDKNDTLKNDINFSIHFENHHFSGTGKIVTRFDDCYGLSIDNEEENSSSLGWASLYSIINKRNLYT